MQTNAVSYRTKQQNLLKAKTQSFQEYLPPHPATTPPAPPACAPPPPCTTWPALYPSPHAALLCQAEPGDVSSAQGHSISRLSPHQIRKSGDDALRCPEGAQHAGIAHRQLLRCTPFHIQINTELLLERKDLEQKIAFLREEIAKEKKLFARAEISCKKANNDIERAANSTRDLENKSDRLNAGISEARQDCN